MISGPYRPIDYASFQCPKAFEILQQNRNRVSYLKGGTCGTHCIQTLTGLTVKFIESKRPKSQGHLRGYWSDNGMMGFLRSRGFKTAQLTKAGVAHNSNPGYHWSDWSTPITSNHVLVCNLLMNEDEASWVIITANYYFHNHDMDHASPLLFVNRPSQSIWMVAKNSWK